MRRHAYHPGARFLENHTLASEASRDILYKSWAPFWDLSKHFLIEKSPRHTLMTRFLQEVFKPSKTHYIAVIRHPLGSTRFWWARSRRAPNCGREPIRHWLQIYKILREDAAFLSHLHMVQAERLYDAEPRISLGIINKLFRVLGLPASAAASDRIRFSSSGNNILMTRNKTLAK